MKFKSDLELFTTDLYYDLFGGCFQPKDTLEDDSDISKVQDAIGTIEAYLDELEDNGLEIG